MTGHEKNSFNSTRLTIELYIYTSYMYFTSVLLLKANLLNPLHEIANEVMLQYHFLCLDK